MGPTPDKEHSTRHAKEFLANAFNDQGLAQCLLNRVGFPRSLVPGWGSALIFWDRVTDLVSAGAEPGSIQRLIDEGNALLHKKQVKTRRNVRTKRSTTKLPFADRSINRQFFLAVLGMTSLLGLSVGFSLEPHLLKSATGHMIMPPAVDERSSTEDEATTAPSVRNQPQPAEQAELPSTKKDTPPHSSPQPLPPSHADSPHRRTRQKKGKNNRKKEAVNTSEPLDIRDTLENEARKTILSDCNHLLRFPLTITCTINTNWSPVATTIKSHHHNHTRDIQPCVESSLRAVLAKNRGSPSPRPLLLEISLNQAEPQ